MFVCEYAVDAKTQKDEVSRRKTKSLKRTKVFLQVLLVFLEGHSVHSGGRFLSQMVEAFPQIGWVEQPVESAKPVRFVLYCFLGYGPQGG